MITVQGGGPLNEATMSDRTALSLRGGVDLYKAFPADRMAGKAFSSNSSGEKGAKDDIRSNKILLCHPLLPGSSAQSVRAPKLDVSFPESTTRAFSVGRDRTTRNLISLPNRTIVSRPDHFAGVGQTNREATSCRYPATRCWYPRRYLDPFQACHGDAP